MAVWVKAMFGCAAALTGRLTLKMIAPRNTGKRILSSAEKS
jgi:hypothetical protein